MCNISSASGTLTISSTSKETVETLRDLIKDLDHRWEYSTYFDEEGEMSQNESGGYSFEAQFGGNGRWMYSYNIEYFTRWLMHDFMEWGYTNFPVEHRLYENSWEILFDYLDEESGCSVLYEETARLIHKAHTPIDKTTMRVESHTDYDYTIANLVKLGGRENIDDAIEYVKMTCGYDDEDIRSGIEEAKKQLCDDSGKSWNELLNENPYLKKAWEKGKEA